MQLRPYDGKSEQTGANYIGARPQQLRRAYQVQLQQNFHPERF